MKRVAALVLLASTTFATVSLGIAAEGTDSFDGIWVLQLARSSERANFSETVTISHKNGVETYQADVMRDGKRSGMRYEASSDGKPYPYFDIVTGEKRGTTRLTQTKPWLEISVFVPDSGSGGPPPTIEHWLSNDGRSFISVLKDKQGDVRDVLVWEKK